MGKAMRESVTAAYDYVPHRRQLLQIASEVKDG
jgi:hypothetical protein